MPNLGEISRRGKAPNEEVGGRGREIPRMRRRRLARECMKVGEESMMASLEVEPEFRLWLGSPPSTSNTGVGEGRGEE